MKKKSIRRQLNILYKVFGVWIACNINPNGKFWSQISIKSKTKDHNVPYRWEVVTAFYDYESPEKAYKASILHALTHIINNNPTSSKNVLITIKSKNHV